MPWCPGISVQNTTQGARRFEGDVMSSGVDKIRRLVTDVPLVQLRIIRVSELCQRPWSIDSVSGAGEDDGRNLIPTDALDGSGSTAVVGEGIDRPVLGFGDRPVALSVLVSVDEIVIAPDVPETT